MATFEQDAEIEASVLEMLSIVPGKVRPIMERFEADRHCLERKYPLALSGIRRARLRQFFAGWQAALDSLDFETLGQDDRIDFLLFRNHLRHQLRRLEIDSARAAETAPLLPFLAPLLGLEEQRQKMEWVQPEAAAALLDAAEKQIRQAQHALDADAEAKSAWKPSVANRAAEAVETLRHALKRWNKFYNGYDPLFTWWAAEPYRAVDTALEEYATYLKEHLVGGGKGAIIGDPLGRDALLAELAFEMIPYTPEELIAIGEKELGWCETEIERIAAELGLPDRHAALEHIKSQHRPPGQQPEMIREMALEAIAFLQERDLVTIPPLAAETWRMEMMTPEQQLVNPFFLGGELIQVSFPTHTMTHAQKQMSLRGNNPHFARATVQHELIPGHHLQMFMMARHRTYRRVVSTSFWIEGWALYWEMRLWDLGFPLTPENRLGMLFWRSHRAARIVFSLKFHLEQMTAPECIAMLIERVGHEPANAEAEVRRSFKGDYGPLYQAAYMLGGLQMRALHAELVARGQMTERAFHDAILRENSIPIEMLRAKLNEQLLPRDFVAAWRFYLTQESEGSTHYEST
jgi:uncharacterized protein (DUF885 family)